MKRILFILIAAISIISIVSCSKIEEPAITGSGNSDPVEEVKIDSISIWLPPYLPEELANFSDRQDGLAVYRDPGSSDLVLDVSDEALVSEWVYTLVAPFSTVEDTIPYANLRSFWSSNLNSEIPFDKLLVDGSTKAIFEKLWGPASNENVFVLSSDDLLSAAWDQDKSWALIPFENLEPQWKVVALDGQSPLDKNFLIDRYPLIVPFSVIGAGGQVSKFQAEFGRNSSFPLFPATNREADKLTTVMVTGVTALVRATAFLMERNGMTYPAIDIGDTLRSADILHISNEIPFTSNCPNPFSKKDDNANLVFCSKPEYIQLLEAIGTDVVELTGDHFRDWGAAAMLNTIGMYEQRGWQYYGGGKDFPDGIKPALFEHNGNKIAFLGCNAKPPGYATASETSPGAVHCDMALMAEKIREVISQGYLPIFTFQHLEYYSYKINPHLVEDFHTAADAGAVIVSGSQAHQPHAFEFYKVAMLHYGLGNLFFDQYDESLEQREAFIDQHIFYDGQYIGTELITIKFVDMARSRFMDPEERITLLENIFFASGW